MTLRLTFGVLPWTLEDTDLRWHVSCQSPSDKLSLWSRIFLYFVCAQMLGYLLQVSSTYIGLRVASCESCGRARPTHELIRLPRMRTRDMDILFDSGVGSSISDSVRLASTRTTRSSAVLRCQLRIRGRLKVCEFALLRAS